MSLGSVVYYDFDHCREFLEGRAADLRDRARGLDTLATLRELYYAFSYEALEQQSIVIGQFDTGVVYLFVPDVIAGENFERTREIAESKAIELLDSSEPPLVIELMEGQNETEHFSSRGTIQSWMREDFLDEIILPARVQIILFFDGGSFFEQVLRPQLEKHHFKLGDTYVESAETGELRVKHRTNLKRTYRIPWVTWVREMMGGGYNVVYLMACFSAYLEKLKGAVVPN